MKKLLLINANENLENSRTYYLTKKVIEKYELDKKYQIEELNLFDLNLSYNNEDTHRRKSELIIQNKFDDPIFDLAKKFRDADFIIVSAPNYDFSYPAVLKVYIENISTYNLLYKLDEKGQRVGLCNAQTLLYITSRGENVKNRDDYGYKNIEQVAKSFGVKETKLIGISKMDIVKRPFREIDDFVEKLDSLENLK